MSKATTKVEQMFPGLMQNQTLRKNWSTIHSELTGNLRLRIGLWSIIAIVLFYFGLILQDEQGKIQAQIPKALQRLEQSSLVAEQDYWQERQQQASRQFLQLVSGFHPASTAGIAKATLQQLLRRNFSDAGFEQVKISVQQLHDSNVEMIDEQLKLWVFTARVVGDFNGKYLQNFLSGMAEKKWHYVIEKLDIGQQRTPRFSINIKYWFVAENSLSQMAISKLPPASQSATMTDQMKPIQKGNNNSPKKKTDIPDELFN